jgi:hypothetical protein
MDRFARRSRAVAVAATAAMAGCFPPVPKPPTSGYGAPYHGTGAGIYVKDSRSDWSIKEGQRPLTSEQALEAAGDAEYEARRQLAKQYNDRLYDEGYSHHRRAYMVMGAGVAAIVLGGILYGLAPSLQNESIQPATADMPEMRTYTSGGAANGVANLGFGLAIAGVAVISYAYHGGREAPPYHEWHTPAALDRPAYVRQQTEPYNEKIGAPSLPDLAPGTKAIDTKAIDSRLRPPPPSRDGAARRHMPPMRGNR